MCIRDRDYGAPGSYQNPGGYQQQYGQSVTDEKNIEQTVARVMSNKDEVKRLTEQLSGERILNFFKENISYKSKKLNYDQFIKEAYQV